MHIHIQTALIYLCIHIIYIYIYERFDKSLYVAVEISESLELFLGLLSTSYDFEEPCMMYFSDLVRVFIISTTNS